MALRIFASLSVLWIAYEFRPTDSPAARWRRVARKAIPIGLLVVGLVVLWFTHPSRIGS